MSILIADEVFVESIGSFQQVTISIDPQLVDFISNATDGATGKLPGRTDWTGTIQCLGLQPQLIPGADFAFEGMFQAGGGSSDDIGLTGSAYVESVSYTIPVEAGGPIVQTINFSADGALTRSTTLDGSVEVTTLPDYEGLDATEFVLQYTIADATPTYVSMTLVRTINFEVSCPGVAYVDAGQWKRNKGNFAASLSYDFFTDSALTEPWLVEGSDYNIAIYNTVGTQIWWDFWYMTYGPTSNILANRETREPIGATGNLMHTAISDISGTASKGKIGYWNGSAMADVWNWS